MAKYGIPVQVRNGFKKFISLSDQDIESLSNILKSTKIGEDISSIIENTNQRISVSDNELENILRSLFSMVDIFLNSGNTNEKFSEDFSSSYGDTFKDPNKDDIEILRKNIIKILSSISNSVKYTIKSRDLQTENLNNFSEARIISDVRIVYDDENELNKKAQYALVVHQLKIRYFTSIHPANEIYISLNLSDLHALEKTIIRAIEKDNLIRNKNHELTFIDIK